MLAFPRVNLTQAQVHLALGFKLFAAIPSASACCSLVPVAPIFHLTRRGSRLANCPPPFFSLRTEPHWGVETSCGKALSVGTAATRRARDGAHSSVVQRRSQWGWSQALRLLLSCETLDIPWCTHFFTPFWVEALQGSLYPLVWYMIKLCPNSGRGFWIVQ